MFLIFFLPFLAFGQMKKKDLYQELLLFNPDLNEHSFELVIEPYDYLPDGDTNVVFIEFFQDTLSLKNTHKVFSCITLKEGFDKPYIIGTSKDYLTEQDFISVIVFQHLKDGTVVEFKVHKHFKDLIPANENIDYAEYSIEPGNSKGNIEFL